MSKKKPDQVVELRISLQDKLSSQVDTLVGADSIKDVAQSIDQLLSFENAYIIVTVIEMLTGKEILPGTPNDIYQLIDWVRDKLVAAEGVSFNPTKEEAESGEYSGFGGFIRFVWQRASVAGWVTSID